MSHILPIRCLTAILFTGFLAVFVASCSDKKEKAITWTLTLNDTGSGVLMDITGASILFEGITYDGTNRGELTIFDPDGYIDSTGIGGSMEGWSSPEKPGRSELGAHYWSAQQKCEIHFGSHKLTIRNKGKTLEINGESFQIDPTKKPRFFVSTEDGKINVTKQQWRRPTRRSIQRRATLLFEFGLPFSPWMSYTLAKEMSKRVLIRSALALGMLFLVAMAALYAINWNHPTQQFRRAIIVEHANYSSDEFGDYGNIVKGRIKDVPFDDLAKILKLTSHATKPLREVEPDAPGWQLFQNLEWWRLPDSFDEIYYDLSPGSQCLLGRRGNEVFLQDLTW